MAVHRPRGSLLLQDLVKAVEPDGLGGDAAGGLFALAQLRVRVLEPALAGDDLEVKDAARASAALAIFDREQLNPALLVAVAVIEVSLGDADVSVLVWERSIPVEAVLEGLELVGELVATLSEGARRCELMRRLALRPVALGVLARLVFLLGADSAEGQSLALLDGRARSLEAKHGGA